MRFPGRWLLLCVMLLTLALPAWAAPREESRVEMSVQPANEGRAKPGGWVTVLVDLTNQGPELSGELVVETDGDMPHPQYVVPVTLPAGGRKRIPVSLQSIGNSAVAVSLRSGGMVVAERQVNFTWLPVQAAMVGILSGDEQGIPALNQLGSSQGQTAQAVRLTAASFPDRAALLKDFDVIALSRFDTSTLSRDQLRALENWVGRGGTLLLAGGPEWKRTLGALPPSLLPVQVTGVREVALAPLGELAAKPLAGSGAVSVVQIRVGQSLLNSGETPLITSAPVGSGQVLFLAFDPGLNPVAGWAGQSQLYNRLLAGAIAGTFTDWPGEADWMLQEALQRIPDWGLPGVWTVALLLGGYLLLIGPANYTLLKRLDRREWGWVTVPALSILFVGAVYLAGFGRFQPMMSHLITITELSPSTGTATMTAHLGVYAPSRNQLSLPIGEGGLIKPFLRGSGREGQRFARVVAGDQTTVELLELNNYSMGGFSMEKDLDVRGGLILAESQIEGGALKSRLKNSLPVPVTDLMITAGNAFHQIARLEPGQLSEPFSLDLSRPGSLDPKMRAERPMGFPGPAAQNGQQGPDYHRRRLILDSVYQTMTQPVTAGVVVSGWIDQPLAPVNLPDLGKMVGGANLVHARLPLPVGGDGNGIPPGVILGHPIDPKSAEWIPSGYMLHPGSAIFTLLLPPLDPSRVGSVELHLGLHAPPAISGIKVSVKNQKRGDWLPLDGETARLPGWEEYISPVGLIELRYETAQNVELQPPTVAVLGVER